MKLSTTKRKYLPVFAIKRKYLIEKEGFWLNKKERKSFFWSKGLPCSK